MTNQDRSDQAKSEVEEFKKKVEGLGEKDSVVGGHLSGIAGNTQETYGGDPRDVRRKLDETVESKTPAAVASGTSWVGEAMSGTGERGPSVEDAGRRAGSQARDKGEQTYSGGERAVRTLARQLEQQTIAPLLVAGVLGIAIGYLLPRR